MKSDLVFSATKSVANRYLLCRIAARTTRVLHFASANTQDAITDAFVRIGNQPSVQEELGNSPELLEQRLVALG